MRFYGFMLALCLVPALVSPTFAVGTVLVYPNGETTVTVPASQYINVFSKGTATVSKSVGYPNLPSNWVLETNGNIVHREVTFGPYTYATQVKIEAGPDGASYSVGSGAVVLPCQEFEPILPVRAQLAPATATTTATMTSAQLLSGIIVFTDGGSEGASLTLPTGALLDAATNLSIGQGFEWTLVNASTALASYVTVVAGSGHTIVGTVRVPANFTTANNVQRASSGTFFSRKTAADTFITYRQN